MFNNEHRSAVVADGGSREQDGDRRTNQSKWKATFKRERSKRAMKVAAQKKFWKKKKQYYCDYCDTFLSNKPRFRQEHDQSVGHIKNYEAYYDKLWKEHDKQTIDALNLGVKSSRLDIVQQKKRVGVDGDSDRIGGGGGGGMTAPLAATNVGGGIIVGNGGPSSVVTTTTPINPLSVRVGHVMVSEGLATTTQHVDNGAGNPQQQQGLLPLNPFQMKISVGGVALRPTGMQQ